MREIDTNGTVFEDNFPQSYTNICFSTLQIYFLTELELRARDS